MDAKAKVVQRWEPCSEEFALHMEGDPDGDYVKFTDHEAALADWKLLVEEYKADGLCAQSKWHAAEAKLTTLLTGLEALATKWAALSDKNWTDYEKTRHKHEPDFEAQGKANVFADCCEELRTLTNPANSENHEVLKS